MPGTMARAYHESAPAAGDRVALIHPGGRFEQLDPGSPAWAAVVAWLDVLG